MSCPEEPDENSKREVLIKIDLNNSTQKNIERSTKKTNPEQLEEPVLSKLKVV